MCEEFVLEVCVRRSEFSVAGGVVGSVYVEVGGGVVVVLCMLLSSRRGQEVRGVCLVRVLLCRWWCTDINLSCLVLVAVTSFSVSRARFGEPLLVCEIVEYIVCVAGMSRRGVHRLSRQ